MICLKHYWSDLQSKLRNYICGLSTLTPDVECVTLQGRWSLYRCKEETGTHPRTMTSLVSSWDTQGLQSQIIRNLAQSLWRNRRVAPIRSRSFILLGPYWTADDSSLVKKSLWNTGGASLKYRAANLMERSRKWVRVDVACRNTFSFHAVTKACLPYISPNFVDVPY